jgi:hypothetical protein
VSFLPQEIPEPRLGDDLVGRKDTHAVDFGGWFCLCGQMATYNLVFVETHLYDDQFVRPVIRTDQSNPVSKTRYWYDIKSFRRNVVYREHLRCC